MSPSRPRASVKHAGGGRSRAYGEAAMIKFYGRAKNFHPDDLGLLPMFWFDADPRSASDQLNERYAHGGGFSPFGDGKFRLDYRETGCLLKYPGDTPFREIARAILHSGQDSQEEIIVFDAAIVVIRQPKTGEFVVTRCD